MICPVLLDNDIKVCLRQWEKQKVNMVWQCLETCVWTGESIFLLFVLPPPASPPPSFFYFYSLAPSDYKTPPPPTHPGNTTSSLLHLFSQEMYVFNWSRATRSKENIITETQNLLFELQHVTAGGPDEEWMELMYSSGCCCSIYKYELITKMHGGWGLNQNPVFPVLTLLSDFSHPYK